jgi:beta-lactamase regulating signal transducer with metallopeptidase domain
MILTGMEKFALIAVERVINSLPAGLLIALGVSLLLRLMRQQNSGTRFAMWLIALVGIVSLPFLGISGPGQHIVNFHSHSEFVVPSFWALAFLMVWAPVACAAIARVAVGLLQIRQIRKSCTEIYPANLDPALRTLLEQSNRPIRLLVSDKVRVPAAVGFVKPAVVLPAWILHEFSCVELRPILIHELAHLRRYDSWTNLFQKVARALFFFHPAIWWIDARLSLEREMACDDAVLTATINPRAYAESLIGLLEKSCSRRGWTMVQAAVTRARETSQRISRILSASGSATTRVALPTLGLAAALFVACYWATLGAPRLLAFAPDTPVIAARVQPRLLEDNEAGVRTSQVVSAAYYPKQETNLVRNAAIRHTISSRHHPVRSAMFRKTRRSATPPFVMASFITSGVASQPVVPTFLVIETSVAGSGEPTSELPAGDARKLQNGEQTEMQVQTLQFVHQDAAGIHIRFLRILISMPAPNATHSGSMAKI